MPSKTSPCSTDLYDSTVNCYDRCEPKHEQQRVLRRAQQVLHSIAGLQIWFILGSIPSSISSSYVEPVEPVEPCCVELLNPVLLNPNGSVEPRMLNPLNPQENVEPSEAC